MSVLTATLPETLPAEDGAGARLRWRGPDDRGLVLEIIGLDEPTRLVIIHAMPQVFRDRGKT